MDMSCAHQRLSDRMQETAALQKARDSSLISAASGKQIQFVSPGDSNLDSEKNCHKQCSAYSSHALLDFNLLVHAVLIAKKLLLKIV